MFLFFLIISTTLWLLLKLSHEYTATIVYPVTLVNLPESGMVSSGTKLELNLRVKAYGYNLIRYKLFKYYNPIQLSAEKVGLTNGKHYVVVSNRQGHISSQLNSELALIGFSPDTLFFTLSPVVTKEVYVEPKINLTFVSQHMQAGKIKVIPEKVTLKGPSSVLDTINNLSTHPLSFQKVSDNIETVADVVAIEGVTISPRKVKITIPVDKFTETRLKVPVECINTPQGYEVKFSPDEVTIVCNVTVSKYYVLRPEHFRVVCDYSELVASNTSKTRVSVERYPDFVGRVQVEPRYVDFVILKK